MYFRAETRDGNYQFSFSTDGTNFTPQNLASVTDGNVRFFSVPVATARAAAESGTLYIASAAPVRRKTSRRSSSRSRCS